MGGQMGSGTGRRLPGEAGPETLVGAWLRAGHRATSLRGAVAVCGPVPWPDAPGDAVPSPGAGLLPFRRPTTPAARWRRRNRHVAAAALLAFLGETAACRSLVEPPAAPAPLAAAPAPPERSAVLERSATRERAAVESPSAPEERPARAGEVATPAPARRPGFAGTTELVAFATAPFPYDGAVPERGPFLDVVRDGARGHRTARGQVLWESETFNDSRVLIHVPAGFDPNRPAVLVLYYHGHGAILGRDVLLRQRLPAQVTGAGVNAVLLAPQFAVDARDSSAGRFWEPGGFGRFLDEAASRLAERTGAPRGLFATMPVVLVAYSGGFAPAAWSLRDAAGARRVRGVVLLDALYGETDTYAAFAARGGGRFLVSAYTRFTEARNAELERGLARRGVSVGRQLPETLAGGATFLPAGPDVTHADFVTQAWAEDPVADILRRLPLDRPSDASLAALGR
ncbi:hypothetical protein [Methylobacterium sp. WSM2598]|uniref:hypothetical protein n=1 Tax=Methylobacterium sp. WSM2598 TaxID=398261 RepID=UPI0003815416|nr:hypothetical protein [Methylobacterium sp. WSM2598]